MSIMRKFTTSSGIYKILGSDSLMWCEEIKDWIECDNSKFKQEMKINYSRQKIKETKSFTIKLIQTFK